MDFALAKERIQRAIKTSRFKNDIRSIAVFGSVARGEAREDSDVDLLIDFEPNSTVSLFEIINIQDEFGQALQKKVDVVSRDGVSPFLREEILNSAKSVYEKS